MQLVLSPSTLNGELAAPPSKSYMHRALICAAAADKPTKIICDTFSDDICATMDCLKALGARIENTEGGVIVSPVDKSTDECVLDCNESGSTLRFMLPFAAALGKKCIFCGAKRLGERPLLPLAEVLLSHGAMVKYEKDFLPCSLSGTLSGEVFEIRGDISSQFITGLLFALGVMGGGEIRTITPLKSAPYVDITMDMLGKFGVRTEKTANGYIIPKGQAFTSPGEIVIEGDYSNAAFWLVGGAVASDGGIKITSLLENSLQGDRQVVEVLRKMGADITRTKEGIMVKKASLKGTEVDCTHIPDIVPILCVAATAAEGKTVFKNISRLREKESDRVKSTLNLLHALGGKAECEEDTIIVEKSTLTGGTVNSENDHRIAMSGAIASLLCNGEVIIEGAGAVNKSYGDFYDKFKQLGGKVK